ncbi:MAG: hypothetical protein JRF02_09650 [Deltaproteobacteria bacterium]|jgi:hypothetical protein|nr:hypothetical protein [Deltaproteobacteria bacterium]
MLLTSKGPECNPLTLAFSGDNLSLESLFLEEYYNSSLKTVRISLIIACILYGSYGVLDALILLESRNVVWLIRFGVAVPTIFLGFLFSFSTYFKKFWQETLAICVLVAGLSVVAMIIFAKSTIIFLFYAGLILVIMYCYTFLKMRFIGATATCSTIILCYNIAAIWLVNTPLHILINNNFFLLGANFIGMFASYTAEYQARKNFYLFILLESEKGRVKKINRKLKNKIRELREASEKIKTLKGLIPICSYCKKIRDDKGYWNQIDVYISQHSDAEFSHGVCMECMRKYFPEMYEKSAVAEKPSKDSKQSPIN